MIDIRNEASNMELHIDGEIHMDQSLWDWFMGVEDKSSAISLRAELENNDEKPITVWINSMGGDVFAASVLYTALKKHTGKVTVIVDGSAMSAASVIAMGGDEILMSETSIMMIHNPSTYAEGDYREMEKTADILNEVKETIINAYVTKTGHSRDEISQLMDDETWMSAKKAIDMGFADGIYGEQTEEPDDERIKAYAKKIFNAYKGSWKPIKTEEKVEDVAEVFELSPEEQNNMFNEVKK